MTTFDTAPPNSIRPDSRQAFPNREIPLTEIVEILQAGRRWIIVSVLLFLFLGVAHVWRATPIYLADATLQLERQKSLLESQMPDAWWAGMPRSTAEMEIIQSRGVVGAVVKQLKLDISTRPRYFPIVGAAIARRAGKSGEPGAAWLGLRQFAWAGERLRVDRLTVPAEFEGKRMTLIAGKDGAYQLLDHQNKALLVGRVGAPAGAETVQGQYEIFVSEMIAHPRTEFGVVRFPFDDVVNRLRKRLKVKETNRQSDIIQIALDGAEPNLIAQTVDAVVQTYVRQNVERQSEEAARMLEFVNGQLPGFKSQVDAAEAALKDYKTRSGTNVDLTIEAQATLARLAEVDKQISLLDLERSELRQRFTERHPLVGSLQEKQRSLEQSRAEIESQLKQMPDTEWQSVRLIRNVKVANALYTELLNKGQELKVSKAGTIGNVRIVDLAVVPRKPVKPKPMVVLGLSLLVGGVLGVAVVFLRQAMRRTLEHPDALEQDIGLPVYCTIPHSSAQRRLARRLSMNPDGSGELTILAKTAPQDNAVEGLRSLRTSLQFALLDAGNRIIAIHGPTASLGKSFLSVNLAYVLADVGNKVLLIDGDLRKGHLHLHCAMNRERGLSEYLAGTIPLADAIRQLNGGKFHFLPTGTLPPNPAELLMHERFNALLADATNSYSHVIIDCPPVLNLADALIIGKLAGTNFVVARAGVSTLDDVRFAVSRLTRNGIKPDGFLFNDLSIQGAKRAYRDYYGTAYSHT